MYDLTFIFEKQIWISSLFCWYRIVFGRCTESKKTN